MKKKLFYSIGGLLTAVLIFTNVSIVSTNLITTLDLNVLKSQACYIPEGQGTVLLMHLDQCFPDDPYSIRYGCMDGGWSCAM